MPPSLKDQWPGYGKAGSGSHSEAGLKLHLALDLVGGELLGPALTPARTHDRAGPHQAHEFEGGSLRIADLGYFNLKRLGELERAGVYFLTKVQTGSQVYRANGTRVGMGQWLAELPAEQSSLDQTLEVGPTERLKCRVVGWRVPNEVSQARQEEFKHLERKRQRPISGEKLEMSYWTVYLTNVEADKRARRFWEFYRRRLLELEASHDKSLIVARQLCRSDQLEEPNLLAVQCLVELFGASVVRTKVKLALNLFKQVQRYEQVRLKALNKEKVTSKKGEIHF